MQSLKLIPGILGCLLLLGSPITAGAGAHKQPDAADKSEAATCPAGKEDCQHQHAGEHQHKHGHGHGHGRRHGGPGGKGGMFGEDFNLTEQQKQDMAALMQIYGPRLGDIRKRGQEDRKQLMAMKPDDPAYGDLTDSVAKEAAASASEVVVLLAELQTNAYALLTPEQQEKSGEFRQNMIKRMEERGERRKDGKGPRGRGGYGMWGQGKHGSRCDGEDCPYRDSTDAASDDKTEAAADE